MGKRTDYKKGDRVEWVGPALPGAPQPGERGTVLRLDPLDDIIDWDGIGTEAGSIETPHIRRVDTGSGSRS
jgi:hypothetical protein